MRIPPGLERGRSPLYQADKYGIDAYNDIFKEAHAIFAPEPNPGKRFQHFY